MEALRKKGYTVAVVEKWNAFVGIRQDLFGFIDLVAMHPEYQGLLGIQVTSQSHVAERIAKCLASKYFPLWLKCGNEFEVHGWAKKGPRGKRKLWEVSIRVLTLSDLIT